MTTRIQNRHGNFGPSFCAGALAFVALAVASGCAETPAPVAPPAAPPAPVPVVTGATAVEEAPPALRLPSDTVPVAEAIELHVDPRQDRFSGAVDIDVRLERPRSVIWLHGQEMHVVAATVTPEGAAPVAATWQQKGEGGLAALTLPTVAPAGKARLHIAFDAPFARGHGLYKVKEAGVDYAFTQFEAVEARMSFPCFDEPGFKIPFTTTLVVPTEMQAVANTHEVSRTAEGTNVRVAFAPTLPLPSYLVAFAVGPLDVVPVADVPPNAVRSRPLPLRGIAPHGRGKEMAYALAHTGEILSVLEQYFGIEYPWDKLDILAVPGKGGAMENAGAVTFGERLLMFDGATAPVAQRRRYANVMAHELAHQWTGDLVTMAWWDDTWLNEAFATWIAAKAAQTWDPKLHQDVDLLRGAEGAMWTDSLVSARAIRQPIASAHDIENAFDGITYQKGGGVLAMFERFVGPETWQKGLHAYLVAHRYGNATADDFLDAESAAAGHDVKAAFHTFLDRPGVPFLDVRTSCAPGKGAGSVEIKQSRYLPIGSTGSANETWQVPFCERVRGQVSCRLLTEADTTIDLGASGPATTCPMDVFPNADAAGYYRFTLAPKDLAEVRRKLPSLSTRERLAYGNSLQSTFARATMPMKDVFDAASPLAADPDPAVAVEPMQYVRTAHDWLFSTPLRDKTEAYARGLYGPVARRLGWNPKKDENDETRALRASVAGFLAMIGRDPEVRAQAKKRGLAYIGAGKDWAIHPEAVDANLADLAVAVVGEDADRATWEGMKKELFASVDETVRRRLAAALGAAKDPQLAAAARELVLNPELRDSEMLAPLGPQLADPQTRDVAWAWIKERFDDILKRMPQHHGGVQVVGAGRSYCDEAHAHEIEAFFTPRIQGIDGGPRALASTLEEVRLCAARRSAQEASARSFFTSRR